MKKEPKVFKEIAFKNFLRQKWLIPTLVLAIVAVKPWASYFISGNNSFTGKCEVAGFSSQMHFVAEPNSLGRNSNWVQSIKFIEVAGLSGLSYKI